MKHMPWHRLAAAAALLATRRELSDYALVMAGTCLFGLIVFYFWPTAVPPADVDWAEYPQVNFLKELDASGDAFPSVDVVAG